MGLHISLDLTKLFQANYDPLFKELKKKLKMWHKMFLSWLAIFPQFLFFFRTLDLPIPQTTFNQWQKLILEFFWLYEQHRINAQVITRPAKLGGLNIPNLQLYYESAQLVNAIKFSCFFHHPFKMYYRVHANQYLRAIITTFFEDNT